MNLKSTTEREDERFPVMAAASILACAAGNPKQELEDDDDEDSVPRATAIAGGTGVGPLSETITHEQRWDTMFLRLKAYKVKHGNCLVPNRYAEDTQLGSWVSAQRRQYKIVTSGGNESAAMTPERAKKLRDIGFEWSTTNPRNVPWEQRYTELKAFVKNYGHAEVPMRWEENPQLSNWVSKQRHQYKLMLSNRPTRLNRKRVAMLDEIGFVWEASRRRLLDGKLVGSDEDEDNTNSNSNGKDILIKKKKPRLTKAKAKSRSEETPVFIEGKRGRYGMDPPAGQPTPGTIDFAQAQAMAAAGPGGVMQANFGLWAAAMAAGQGAAFMPGTVPPAVAAAAGASLNPQLFMPMMPFGGAAAVMRQMSGIPFAPGQMAASMMPRIPLDGGQKKSTSLVDAPTNSDDEEEEKESSQSHEGSQSNGEETSRSKDPDAA